MFERAFAALIGDSYWIKVGERIRAPQHACSSAERTQRSGGSHLRKESPIGGSKFSAGPRGADCRQRSPSFPRRLAFPRMPSPAAASETVAAGAGVVTAS